MRNEWLLIVGGILLCVVLVGFSFWFNNGGQWGVDGCTFTKEPVACRILKDEKLIEALNQESLGDGK